MTCSALIAIASGWLYYRNINLAEDPRVIDANKSFKTFSIYFENNNYDEALLILDNIEKIYNKVPGYKDSYEIGVINNNRAAIYLVQLEEALLSTDNLKIDQRPIFLDLAKEYSNTSKLIYISWLEKMGNLNDSEIKETILPFFEVEDPAFKRFNFDKILNKRVENIKQSQVETKRRLSVVYTNLGIIDRYQNNPEKAEKYYRKAIELWDSNYVAKNNLNVLLGEPLKKRSVIKQLFPEKK
jgi:tetratricopeptide (TPR) repeat protein